MTNNRIILMNYLYKMFNENFIVTNYLFNKDLNLEFCSIYD